jgi:Beta-lactamase
MSRFAEIWCRGGELDGVRVMSPETMRGAIKQCRRLRPDFAVGLQPARWGTGFILGTNRFGPFGRNAPAAFGHLGLVDIAIWADPARGLAAGLISSGKPGRDPEARRHTALMDTIAAEIPSGWARWLWEHSGMGDGHQLRQSSRSDRRGCWQQRLEYGLDPPATGRAPAIHRRTQPGNAVFLRKASQHPGAGLLNWRDNGRDRLRDIANRRSHALPLSSLLQLQEIRFQQGVTSSEVTHHGLECDAGAGGNIAQRDLVHPAFYPQRLRRVKNVGSGPQLLAQPNKDPAAGRGICNRWRDSWVTHDSTHHAAVAAAVAEGFEPPDGFSRLSLSRRVH